MSPDGAAPSVYVFYDYVCPYAYLGKHRAERLAQAFDLEFVWLPWEIYPEANPAGEEIGDEYPESPLSSYLVSLAEELDVPLEGPPRAINSNLALRGAEYAKDQGDDVFEAYHDNVFDTVWGHGQDLNDREVLAAAVHDAGMDPDDFFDAVAHNAYQYRLEQVDQAAQALGVQRVPTFVFGDQRIVGNDPFSDSLEAPLRAFLDRRKTLGAEHTTTLEDDLRLYEMVG